MTDQVLTYRVHEVPDPAYTPYRLAAGGDVRTAIGTGCGQVLREIASQPAGSVTVAIRLVFDPSAENGDPQQRLALYIVAAVHNAGSETAMRALLEHGPLSRFYDFQPVCGIPAPSDGLPAGCDVTRREDVVEPLNPPEFNDRVPPVYYSLHCCEAIPDNNYMTLDGVLSGIDEPAVIELCVEPTDASREIAHLTRVLARLNSVNHDWDRDRAGGLLGVTDPDDDAGAPNRAVPLAPLRRHDPLANEILRKQQRAHEALRQPQLHFHIRVRAKSAGMARLLASVVAESAFRNGTYRLWESDVDALVADSPAVTPSSLRVVGTSTHGRLFDGPSASFYEGLVRLPCLASVDELLGVFRLPIASCVSPCCIRCNTDPPNSENEDSIPVGSDLEGGGTDRSVRRDLPCTALVKHVFISGMPGSGKTTDGLHLAFELHRGRIPFLILEPVKTECRLIKSLKDHRDENVRSLARAMQVYTPGAESISPLRYNPLSIPPGVLRDQHADNLLADLKGSMPLSGPMPALIGEALERVLDASSCGDHSRVLDDLVHEVERVLAEKGYAPEVNSNVRAALDVRLRSLTQRSVGRAFQCPKSVPEISELMEVPVLIELARLPKEPACLLTLNLLTAIREHVLLTPHTGKVPRYVIIIEEAHNIVGRNNQAVASEDNPDPAAFAADAVCRMLAELRGAGVGVVILDQIPSAVAADVIKQTSTKIAFRQVDQEDRERLGASMLLNPAQTDELARLTPGEAFFHREGYYRPRRVRTPNLHAELQLSAPPSDVQLRRILQDEEWYLAAATRRQQSELDQLRRRMDSYDRKRLDAIRQVAELVEGYVQAVAVRNVSLRSARLRTLARQARALHVRMVSALDSFVRRSYRPLMASAGCSTETVEERRLVQADLTQRYETVIVPDTQACLEKLNELIARCGGRPGKTRR